MIVCRACKLPHPPTERCEMARRRIAASAKPEMVVNAVVANTNAVANTKPESRHGKYADREARKKYMREYMANYRKKI